MLYNGLACACAQISIWRAYPNTSKAIKRQKQILTTPAGRYAVLESKKTREAAFWKRSGAGWGNSLGSRIAFEADGKYYIHMPN